MRLYWPELGKKKNRELRKGFVRSLLSALEDDYLACHPDADPITDWFLEE